MQKTAYEMRISDWSSDVCSSDLIVERGVVALGDIAAVAGIDRWRGDERPRVEIDQRAVAAEPGGKAREQGRRGIDLVEPLAQPPRAVEPVAELAEIAREIGRAHV